MNNESGNGLSLRGKANVVLLRAHLGPPMLT